MKRIYGSSSVLRVLLAPMAAVSGLASATPPQTDGLPAVTDTGRPARPGRPRHPVLVGRRRAVNGPSLATVQVPTPSLRRLGPMQYPTRRRNQAAAVVRRLPGSARDPAAAGPEGRQDFYGLTARRASRCFLGNGQMLEVGDVVQVSPARSSGTGAVCGSGSRAPADHRCSRRRRQQIAGEPHRPSSLPGQQHRCSRHRSAVAGPAGTRQQAPLQRPAGRRPASQAPLQAPARQRPHRKPVLQWPDNAVSCRRCSCRAASARAAGHRWRRRPPSSTGAAALDQHLPVTHCLFDSATPSYEH